MDTMILRTFRTCLILGLLAAQNLYSQSIYSQPYTFTTLAGNAGHGSSDGKCANARFWWPSGVAVDSAGTLYVADYNNNTIRKVTPGGGVSTLAGLAGFFKAGSADGTGRDARFAGPSGVAVDSAGNVYVADSGNNTIRKVTPAGVVSTLAGQAGAAGGADGTGRDARFAGPSGVAVDSAGIVYVADNGNNTIRKVTPDGKVSTLVDNTGTRVRFGGPSAVAVDSAGNVYVTESGNNIIRKVTPAGVVSTLAGRAGVPGSADGTGVNAFFNGPSGVALDSAGNLYVADFNNHTLRKVTPGGEVSTLAGLAGAPDSADGTGSDARFWRPSGVAVDNAGNVFVAEFGNNTLRKVTPGGEVSTLAGLAGLWGGAGGADGTGSNALFDHPYGVAVDSTGKVFVADFWNSALRMITPDGVVSTLVDSTGAKVWFGMPSGVAVDSAGNVYVAEYGDQIIQKVTPAGEVSTLAGLANTFGSADGTGTNALFFFPKGVAVDRADNVYVADSLNSTIRKITPAGEVSTLVDSTGAKVSFGCPSGVAVDSAGNVYVAATYEHTIRKMTPAGEVSTLAGRAGVYGSDDGLGTNALFDYPTGVAVDSAGNVYVADCANQSIRKITPGGVVSTLGGVGWEGDDNADGTGPNARFWFLRGPTGPAGGVAVDSAGTLYVADTDNNTIRLGRVAPAPPLLSISPAGGQAILSWPLEASNFLVEGSCTLVPAPSWLPLTNAVDTNGKNCVLTNSVQTGARYFRLRLP